VKLFCLLSFSLPLFAVTYQADPSNYRTELSLLHPGDTLALASGTYGFLNVTGLHGTPSAWITITGPGSGSPAIIAATSTCCNTVEISNSSYVAIKNLTIDSKGMVGIFGISAHGTSNITHDILIENNLLIGQNGSQQTVGISTKIPTWGWIIRHNTITGAGTGLYLGSPDGTLPFIAGLIENNLIQKTIGYNMEIKYQIARPTVAGMPTGPSTTIIRNNVFIKDNQLSPDGDRPNLMLGGFPTSGAGSSDLYQVYGNFFSYNPREALLQAEGRVSIHDNVFAGGEIAAMVLHQTYVPVAVAHVYNNTVYSPNKGIYFGTSATVEDAVTGNLVFAATPISGPIAHLSNNIVNTVANAETYVNTPSFTTGAMDFYPRAGQAEGAALDLSLFAPEKDSALDFNGTAKNAVKGAIVFRGAYAGEGANPGWKLQAGIKPIAALSTAPAMVQSLQCAPATVNVGQVASCTVTLVSPVSSPSVVALASSSSAVTVPSSVTLASGSLSAVFSATSVFPGAATVTATLNSSLTSAVITVVQGVPVITALTCSRSILVSGSSALCTVSVNPAPTSSTSVLLSSNSAYVMVPPSVAVAAGAVSATFKATAGAATTQQNATVKGALSGSVGSATLTVVGVMVKSLTASPVSVVSGATAIGTVSLNGAAPPSGAVVTLSTSRASAAVPASVTVPSGATSATFHITAGTVATATSVTISATYGGVTTTTLTVNPLAASAVTPSPAALVGGGTPSANNWVYLNCPAPASGAVLTLTSSNVSAAIPASVTVPAGATYAKFGITSWSVAAYGGATNAAVLTLKPVYVNGPARRVAWS